MPTLHILRAFTTADGRGGNPLGVFLDGTAVTGPAARQSTAALLGFSETVFVEDDGTGALAIYTPATQLPFAGHPLVGTAWLLAREGHAIDTLRPPAGTVPTWQADGLTWIRGRAEWSPAMTLREYPSPAAIDALVPGATDVPFEYAWAWIDVRAGTVRARAFAPGVGIVEDEATGSAAIALGAQLGRALRIRQGQGSELFTQPGPGGTVDVGGHVALDEVRAFALP